jgi:hypothetical protein
MSGTENLSDTIIPKSDQLNADQLVGTTMDITVTKISRGAADQPISIHYAEEDGRPYKPCKTMRKVLIAAWGNDGREWAGKSMTLYNDPEVVFGGIKVGGIRISHLSHIENDLSLSLNKTKGKKALYTVKRMQGVQKKAAPAQQAQAPASTYSSSKTLSSEQQQEVRDALEQAGKEASVLCKVVADHTGFPVDRIEQIPASEFDNVCGWIAQ